MGSNTIMFNPADYNSDVKHMELGTLVYGKQDEVYRYVKVVDNALVAGDVCIYTATEGTVTSDYTGGTAHISIVAGVARCAVTAGNYALIQCKGYCSTINVHEDCAVGSRLTTPSATDGRAALAATPTDVNPTQAEMLAMARVFGYATAVDASNIAPGYLNCV